MDPYKYLNISFNPDGSLLRNAPDPHLPPRPAGEPVSVAAIAGAAEGEEPTHRIVHSNDVPLNPARSTTLRLFLPSAGAAGGEVPLIVYFHGGGYVLFRAASAPFHATCATLAAAVPAAVASVDYRLAPEHRLPAAYADAADAVRWAARSGRRGGTFVMGSHNGASIALRAALFAAAEGVELAGVILNQPHYGGEERTAAEAASVGDRVLPLAANDLLWELALPVGAGRGHEYCDAAAMVAAAGGAAALRRLPPCLVLGRRRDPPRDRQRALVAALREAGVAVEARLDGAGYHAMELFKPDRAAEFFAQVTDFVRRRAASAAATPGEAYRGGGGGGAVVARGRL